MSFNSSEFIPIASKWFSPRVEYEGQGRAEFLEPDGWIEGTAKIIFDETGNFEIAMNIENCELKVPQSELDSVRARSYYLLSGVKPRNIRRLGYGFGIRDTCTKFMVETPQGVFSTIDHRLQYTDFLGQSVIFFPSLSQFDTAGVDSRAARYWALPLSNLVATFNTRSSSELNRHPLRIYPTPPLPDSFASEEEAQHAFLVANSQNLLIVFEFNGGMGFIERLPTFDELKAKLLAGQVDNAVTAIMVGDLGTKSIDFPAIKEWFPLRFLSLLSLATGTDVNTLWIEFRDIEGTLIRRIHFSSRNLCFSKGHVAIRMGHEIGQLLNQAQASSYFMDMGLGAAIDKLVRAGDRCLGGENKLNYLCQAMDTLSKDSGATRSIILADVLDQNRYDRLKETIEDVNKKLQEIINEANTEKEMSSDPGDIEKLEKEVSALQRTVNKLPKTDRIDTRFEKAGLALMEKYKLPDANILDSHFLVNARTDGKKKWIDILETYRNIVTHDSYFDLESGKYKAEDIIRFTRHFHDILLRIVLYMLNYTGSYSPTMLPNGEELIDWVKPDTTPQKLGY
jgi:hypothetical protein